MPWGVGLGMSSSTRLVRGVIRSFAEGILGRLAAAAVDVVTDFRLGILEGEGCDKEGMGAVIAVFVDERRRLGGIVVEKRSVVVDAFGISTCKSGFSRNLRDCGFLGKSCGRGWEL